MKNCDNIIYLDQAAITAQGDYKDLSKKSESFKRVALSQ